VKSFKDSRSYLKMADVIIWNQRFYFEFETNAKQNNLYNYS